MRSLISTLALLAMAVAIYFYLSAHSDLLQSLENISLMQLCLLVALRILYITTFGLFMKLGVAKIGMRLNLLEWFGLQFVTIMGNQLTPFAGGVIVRAVYLKRRHSLSYPLFATLLLANHLAILLAASAAGFFICPFLPRLGAIRWMLMAFFALVMVAIGVILSLPVSHLPKRGRLKGLTSLMNDCLEGWSILRSDTPLLLAVFALASAGIALNCLSFSVTYLSLGFQGMDQAALILGILMPFMVVIYITPGNLGIQELLISMTSGVIGGGVGKGLLVALVIRASTLIPVFILGSMSGSVLLRRMGDPSAGSMKE
jgi:uncharacterized membrane protein YbhN (UPF0104 family)